MIFSPKCSQDLLLSKNVSHDGVMKNFQNLDFLGGAPAGRVRGRWAGGWKFFPRPNLRNNILGKVQKYEYWVTTHLGAVDRNIVPRVILTPPRVQ